MPGKYDNCSKVRERGEGTRSVGMPQADQSHPTEKTYFLIHGKALRGWAGSGSGRKAHTRPQVRSMDGVSASSKAGAKGGALECTSKNFFWRTDLCLLVIFLNSIITVGATTIHLALWMFFSLFPTFTFLILTFFPTSLLAYIPFFLFPKQKNLLLYVDTWFGAVVCMCGWVGVLCLSMRGSQGDRRTWMLK